MSDAAASTDAPASPSVEETPSTPDVNLIASPAARADSKTAVAAAPAKDASAAKPKVFTSVKDLGICHDRNARYRRTMEDEYAYEDGFMGDPTQGYFGIYDGHGGKDAVQFVRDHLHPNFAETLKTVEDVHEAFKVAYVKTDDMIGEAKIQYSGTTTVSAFIRNEGDQRKLYVANVGDARAVLARNGKGLRLTYDHKASDAGETKRIQDAGGFVIMNRVNGILAVTRSLGDRAMKDYVSGEPYTTETVLEEMHL